MVVGYRWTHLKELFVMSWSKPSLTESGFHHRLKSSELTLNDPHLTGTGFFLDL